MVPLDLYRTKLIEAGISPTVQRVAMAEVLLSKEIHISADEVFALVNDKINRSSRATIYNNLNLFESVGFIKSFQIEGGITVYDTNTAPHAHIIDASGKPVDLTLNEDEQSKIEAILKTSLQRQSMNHITFNNMDIVLNSTELMPTHK
jgi:Fur family transcriptional regulator, iron response regulator